MSKKLDIKNLPALVSFILGERTSITRYEAVEVLMELSGLNPPRLRPPPEGATEEEIEMGESITVFDLLKNDVDGAESEYDKAKFGDEPVTDSVIAEKLENIKQSKLILAQAHDFLCTIDDELAKGTLRPPPGTFHAQRPGSITFKSFNEWVTGLQNTVDPGSLDKPPMRGRRKQLDQEDAIKAELLRRGYDLKQLKPPPKNGLGGTCAEIKNAMLAMTHLFGNDRVYQRAWSRLLKERKEIAYAETTHPQNSS